MRRLAVCAALLLCIGSRVADGITARELLDQTRHLAQTSRQWTDRVQKLQLTVVDRRGGERHRALAIYFKKFPQDRNRTLLFFESPPDVKGVGFLQWADPHAKDEQWLYLPELKRVRQISAGAKHESFVGTDFSYDDLAIISEVTDWSDADAHSTLLRAEPLDGQNCDVLEFTPVGKDLSYGKIVAWLRAEDLVMLQYEMYDKSNRLEKNLRMSDVRTIGAIPTAFRMEMRNLQSGSHTSVEFEEVKYDLGLDDALFTQRTLEHGR